MSCNGWGCVKWRVAELRPYPPRQIYEAGRNARKPTDTGMFYTVC